MSQLIDRFEAMLAAGQDTALLRFSLGNAYIDDDPDQAARHLKKAVELDPSYSAAWKILGKALTLCGESANAIAAYRTGIDIAESKGDKQAAKEMQVFLKRLIRSTEN
jgi:Tfp pilus assembly protein PilF